MITQELELNTYNAGYSNMPIILSSDKSSYKNFNYITNICYDMVRITGMDIYTVGTKIYTKIHTVGHNFKKGDDVLIYQGDYQGYYRIMEVVDINYVVIDLVLQQPYSSMMCIAKYIKYQMPPNIDMQCNLDISNTIKDYVRSSIEDSNEVLTAESTKFEFFLVFSEQYEYELEFEDNASISGNVGFYNTSISSLTGIELTIGDTIIIEQDLYQWAYDDNIYVTGDELGFTSSVAHSFEVGDDIIITGQITEPYYNGSTKVKQILSTYSISTWKTHSTSTPTEGGVILASIPPEYNSTAKITDIYIDGVLGLVILTDKPFARNTSPIGGKIRSLTNSKILEIASLVSDVTYAYSTRFDRIDYGGDFDSTKMNRYIIGSGLTTEFSSIYTKTKDYRRIELDAKAFILAHNDYAVYPFYMGAIFKFYTSEENLINDIVYGTSKIMSSPTSDDLYFPVGIYQLIDNSSRIDSVGFDLSMEFDVVKYYTIEAVNISTSAIKSRRIIFKVNSSCNGSLPVYNLMWRDAYGSFITFPFKYVAKKSTDVSKSSYYKREGNFSLSEFTLNGKDRGVSTYYSKSNTIYELTSDWVKDVDNMLFEDLIKSTEIYLQIPDQDNMLVPVILDNKNIEYKSENVDSLFMYSPKVIVAYNDYRF